MEQENNFVLEDEHDNHDEDDSLYWLVKLCLKKAQRARKMEAEKREN